MIKRTLLASLIACGVSTAQAAELDEFNDVAQDITKAPYNAKCNGSADDSPAFEKAVRDGGTFFIPPGSRCMLKSTSDHAWSSSTVFYGLAGARDDTHIDIGSGNTFSLRSGARVGIYNLRIKNGGNFLVANDSLSGTVHKINCVNNFWDNVNTWCLRWGDNSEKANAKIGRMHVENNTAFMPDGGEGLFAFGGQYENIRIVNNFQSGGRRGIRLGFVANDDPGGEIHERTNFLISGNIVRDIDGRNTSSGVTVSCIDAMGRNVIISNNICEDIYDNHEANTECIYSKSQHVVISGNTLNNCGANQGGILLKGAQGGGSVENCSSGACARQSIVSNNTIRNTDTTLNNYNCVWVQSTNAIIEGNHFDGCTNAAVNVSNSGTYRNIVVRNNQVHNHAGPVAFYVQGNKENIVIEGNTVHGFNRSATSSMQGVDIYVRDGADMNGIRIANNRFFFGEQSNTATTGVTVDVLGSGVLEDIEVVGNYFDRMDTCIDVHNNNTLRYMTVMTNQMHHCNTPYKRTGGSVSNGMTSNNRGWSGNL